MTAFIRFFFLSFSFFLLTAAQNPGLEPKAQGSAQDAPALSLVDPWIALPNYPRNNSAVYLSIKNDSDEDIELIGASSMDLANNIELHDTFIDQKGVSKMVKVDKIVIPAKSSIDLKPGGTHIMLFDLKFPLKIGMKVNARLIFLNYPAQDISCEVRSRP